MSSPAILAQGAEAVNRWVAAVDRRVLHAPAPGGPLQGDEVVHLWRGPVPSGREYRCARRRSGIDHIAGFDASGLPVRIAGEVKAFDAAEHFGAKEARRSSRCIQFAMVAAREAVVDSGLDIRARPEEVGVLIACGVGRSVTH